MTDLIGEMYGERAVQAPFGLIVSRRQSINGLDRTMVGGTVLSKMVETDHWYRWRGSVILIPTHIDRMAGKQRLETIDRLMVNCLAVDEVWKSVWRLK